MKRILTILLITISILSCEKQEEITVTLKTSGTLKIQLVDNNSKPIINKQVRLSESSFKFYELQIKYTDNEGKINFGELLEGDYIIMIDTIQIDNIEYSPKKNIHIGSRSNVEQVINIYEKL